MSALRRLVQQHRDVQDTLTLLAEVQNEQFPPCRICGAVGCVEDGCAGMLSPAEATLEQLGGYEALRAELFGWADDARAVAR